MRLAMTRIAGGKVSRILAPGAELTTVKPPRCQRSPAERGAAVVPAEQVEHAAAGEQAGGQVEAGLRAGGIDHAVERRLVAQGRIFGMVDGIHPEAARHGQPVAVHVDRRQMVDARAHQPLQQHQPHEAAADHRHPVTGAGAGVVQPGDHAAHRLDDPALQRDVGVGDAQRPRGGHVVHGGEAARHHRIALRQAADAGAHLEHPAHALMPRRRRARGIAAVPVGVQVPRADAARGRAHLHLARSRDR